MRKKDKKLHNLLEWKSLDLHSKANILLNECDKPIYRLGVRVFRDTPDVSILKYLLSQNDRPYFRLDCIRFFAWCAYYSIEYPEITRQMCIQVARERLPKRMVAGLSKLDNKLWELYQQRYKKK